MGYMTRPYTTVAQRKRDTAALTALVCGCDGSGVVTDPANPWRGIWCACNEGADDPEPAECDVCDGEGLYLHYPADPRRSPWWDRCEECNGTGVR